MTLALDNIDEIEDVTQKFDPVNLDQMNEVKLLSRKDTKYVFGASKLPELLSALKDDYFVLEMSSKRMMQYKTLYYDTDKFDLYTQHHNGKLNRYKVRSREYVESGISFFEVKAKSNKGRTVKTRYGCEEIPQSLDEKAHDFVSEFTPVDARALQPALWVHYKRITLVSKKFDERATIDMDLHFEGDHQELGYPEVVIAEVKQDSFSKDSKIVEVLRDMKIQTMGFSKYCMGVASVVPGVKRNRLKQKLIQVGKLK